MQTIEGARKARDTQIRKHGSVEAWVAFMREQAAIGGRNSTNGGFGSTAKGIDGLTGKERARVVGAIGGQISRRGPKES